MTNMQKFAVFFVLVFIFWAGISAYADTVVTTTDVGPAPYPYFHSGTSVVGSIFYFVGDVVALPFRLLGSLFDSIF